MPFQHIQENINLIKRSCIIDPLPGPECKYRCHWGDDCSQWFHIQASGNDVWDDYTESYNRQNTKPGHDTKRG